MTSYLGLIDEVRRKDVSFLVLAFGFCKPVIAILAFHPESFDRRGFQLFTISIDIRIIFGKNRVIAIIFCVITEGHKVFGYRAVAVMLWLVENKAPTSVVHGCDGMGTAFVTQDIVTVVL